MSKPTISKKVIKEIRFASVYAAIIREHFTVTTNGQDRCFIDNPPENWNNEERQAFDLLSNVEDTFREKVLSILGAE